MNTGDNLTGHTCVTFHVPSSIEGLFSLGQ